jgi:hypothetical protein
MLVMTANGEVLLVQSEIELAAGSRNAAPLIDMSVSTHL